MTVTRAGECSGSQSLRLPQVTCPGPPAAYTRGEARCGPLLAIPRAGPGPADWSLGPADESYPQLPAARYPAGLALPSAWPRRLTFTSAANLALRPKVKVELGRGSEGAWGQGTSRLGLSPTKALKEDEGYRISGARI